MTRITSTLRDELFKFMITSSSVILRIRNTVSHSLPNPAFL